VCNTGGDSIGTGGKDNVPPHRYYRKQSVSMKTEADIKLITACDAGDFHSLREAIRDGGNVNYTTSKGTTPLIVASGKDPVLVPALSFASFLVQSGADPSMRAKSGRSPLGAVLYARTIDPDLVEYLLCHGANPNLEEKFTVNETDYMATFPDIISIHGFPEVLSALLSKYGGRCNLSAEDHRLIRENVKRRISPSIVSKAERKPLIDEMECKLPAAFNANDAESIYAMITAGADYLLKDDAGEFLETADGRTLLHIAAERNDRLLVERLLAAGYDINEPDVKKRTPLWYARRDKRLEQFLIDCGAHTDKPTTTRRIVRIIEQCGFGAITEGGATLTIDGGRRKGRVTLKLEESCIFMEMVFNTVTGEILESTDRSSDPYFKYLDPYDFIVSAEKIIAKAVSSRRIVK
jgi:ankyrin repeat protein